MNRKSLQAILIPICALLIFALGILIGRNRAIDTAGIEADDKLSRALQLIKEQYVDTVNEDRLMDMALTSLFKSLDPHSEYIPASDLQSVNEDLEGSFSGVGISFQIVADTVTVIDAIVGGPAEKLGIMAGDRIISADGEPLAGPAVTNEDVFRLLRGKKGTVVDLEIKRQNSPNSTHFSVTRADIPVNTVDAAYLLDDRMTGYIKLSKFTPSSYTEFMDAMLRLQAEGAKSLILDLRDNPGGYMDQAILIVNQFLPANRKIVFTKARTADNRMSAISDGTGILTRMPVAVLINEYSASASEIIAGAIQDNDRGPVVGRRSYGKGLVQTQATLPDNSAIRLTVARYYTPSGRSIQKEYKIGDVISYEMDIMNRYKRGEFFYMDSIQLDRTRPFRTKGGRTVYGGGGIMPDYFVPEDTTYITSYYIGVNNAGLIQQYSFMLADRYRSLARGMKSASQVLRLLPSDDLLLEGFADYAESKGMPAQWYYIDISAPVMLGQIKAFVVRDLLGYDQFYKVFNLTDRTIEVALDVLKKSKLPASPISR